jgi:hypothetical protein
LNTMNDCFTLGERRGYETYKNKFRPLIYFIMKIRCECECECECENRYID